jgi:hypothetical protein
MAGELPLLLVTTDHLPVVDCGGTAGVLWRRLRWRLGAERTVPEAQTVATLAAESVQSAPSWPLPAAAQVACRLRRWFRLTRGSRRRRCLRSRRSGRLRRGHTLALDDWELLLGDASHPQRHHRVEWWAGRRRDRRRIRNRLLQCHGGLGRDRRGEGRRSQHHRAGALWILEHDGEVPAGLARSLHVIRRGADDVHHDAGYERLAAIQADPHALHERTVDRSLRRSLRRDVRQVDHEPAGDLARSLSSASSSRCR